MRFLRWYVRSREGLAFSTGWLASSALGYSVTGRWGMVAVTGGVAVIGAIFLAAGVVRE